MTKSEENKAATLHYGSRTDVGKIRSHNEDSLIVEDPLFAVADGMGGHEAGEVASEIAIETLSAQAPDIPDSRDLGRAVQAANRAIIRNAENGVGKPGMGTTMTAIILDKTKLVVAQVGDSRAYLLHEGQLTQITRDHSLMADLIESGQITEEEARWHPQRSVITRALGSDPDMTPDLFELEVAEGDRILLCSDGLSGMVWDDQLQQILTDNPDPQDCADALVNAANENGGHDNITAIVIDVTGEEAEKREHKRKRKARRIVITFAIILAVSLAAATFGLYTYARNSAYLADDGGYVAVYSGLPGHFGAVQLSWYQSTSDIRVADLPESTQERIKEGLRVDSLEEAYSNLDSFREEIAKENAPAGGSSSSTTSNSNSSGNRVSSNGSDTSGTSGTDSGSTTGTGSSGSSNNGTNGTTVPNSSTSASNVMTTNATGSTQNR